MPGPTDIVLERLSLFEPPFLRIMCGDVMSTRTGEVELCGEGGRISREFCYVSQEISCGADLVLNDACVKR